MSFTQFIKPYPNGYIDGEPGDTPVTAEILNTNYDGFLLGLNEFLPELAGMVEANPSESATAGNLTKLKVGNSIYLVPSGGSGGSTVEWEQLQLTGTKIATITIDNVPVDVYAPSGGGSGDEVEWTPVVGSGTKIGIITINGVPTDVYAPTPIDVEANPSGSATAGDLTKLKVGSGIYSIPSGGSGGSGHTILDDDGTALAQEDDLQFVGVYSEDDSTDEVTKVNIYREMTKTEFNLLSSDEKKGFIRVTDEPDIYSDGHFQPVIYSTEEREVGVWTDGKPLYQKTIVLASSMSITSNTWTDIDNGDWSFVDTFVLGLMVNANGASVGFVAVDKNTNNNKLRILQTRSTDITCKSVTIQYTKTSDTAGSGTWTPQGVPTHHYSTDEQIIGTWIDGKTLYRKSYEIASLKSSAGYTDYPTNLNNIVVKRVFGDCYFSNGTTRFLGSVAKNLNGQDIEADSMLVQYQGDTNAIRIYVGKDRSAVSAIVHIEYTKSS